MKLFKQLLLLFFICFISNCCFAVQVTDMTASSSEILFFAKPLPASFTVEHLFDRMEKRSEKIDAIVADVEMVDIAGASTAVTLRVKSPDKFSIVYSDGSVSVYFNGSKLWIYMKDLNECFYHYSEPLPWWSKIGGIMTFFEPKKIFMDMTRGTLSAVFDMEAIGREEVTENSYNYSLRLTPKFKDIYTAIFDLGHYEAVFSDKYYLPVMVREYGRDGKLKNQLYVKTYKMNEEVKDELFEYKNDTMAIMMPVSVVIIQKIEDFRDQAIEKINKTKEAMTNRFLNWSF